MRNVTKVLAGMEDLALGQGRVSQQRAGKQVVVGKIDLPYAVLTTEDLRNLDTKKFSYAKLYGTHYRFDPTDESGIKPSDQLVAGSWIIEGIAKWVPTATSGLQAVPGQRYEYDGTIVFTSAAGIDMGIAPDANFHIASQSVEKAKEYYIRPQFAQKDTEYAFSNGLVAVFTEGKYSYTEKIGLNRAIVFKTIGSVEIEWAGPNLIDPYVEGMWEAMSSDAAVFGFSYGECKFTNPLGIDGFAGSYIRLTIAGGFFSRMQFLDSKYTVIRNSNKTGSSGQGSKGDLIFEDCEFMDVDYGPVSFGFYPWWDEQLNTTSLRLIRCKSRARTRNYLGEYVGRFESTGGEYTNYKGVCYQVAPRDWYRDVKWAASSGIVHRKFNRLETGSGSGGSISIDLKELGFEQSDEGYFLLECNLAGINGQARPASSVNINGTNFGTELYKNEMLKFTAQESGGKITLSIVFGANGQLDMRDLVIFKRGTANTYVAHCNRYDINSNEYRGVDWGPCAGIDGRRISVKDNLVIGCKRPVNIDTVSFPDGEEPYYRYPDAFGIVTENRLIACWDNLYVTGGSLTICDNLFQSCGQFSSRATINVNCANREGASTEALDLSSTTEVVVRNNKFVNQKVRLGYISGTGRLSVGEGNTHDLPNPGFNLWGCERDSGKPVRSAVSFVRSGYIGLTKIEATNMTIDLSEEVTLVDNKLGSELVVKFPSNSYNRMEGVESTIINTTVDKVANPVSLVILGGFGTINGGLKVAWPTDKYTARVYSVSANNDFVVAFS